MITVACVLRSGGVYDAGWVDRLQAGVAEHLSAEHRFACLTDMDVSCEAIPLAHGWPGWWSKIELFGLAGSVLYLDLDCIVTGPLDDMVRKVPGFTMCADFLHPGLHNSSVMSWRGDFGEIARLFRQKPRHYQDQYRRNLAGRIGDQAFVEDVLCAMGQKIDTFPMGRVVSYRQRARDAVPPETSVVAFHGRPKPHEVRGGWVERAWTA